jgi:membrane-associated phospholipid phosphatase
MQLRPIAFSILIVSSLLVAPGLACCASAQTQSSTVPDAPQPQSQYYSQVTIANTPRHILSDQLAIWTSPAHLNRKNAVGPTLLVLSTALVMTTDREVMVNHVPVDASLNSHAITASNGLLGGFVTAPAIMYGLGHIHHDDHATETGILAGEAMVNSLAVDEVMKLVSMRERPDVNGSRGKFFQTNTAFDSSFPSTHSMIAWSSAAVIASEFNGPLTQIAAYGLATGVSAARVLGREHFPSDVLVGSAVGWMIGRYVVHRHRTTE